MGHRLSTGNSTVMNNSPIVKEMQNEPGKKLGLGKTKGNKEIV